MPVDHRRHAHGVRCRLDGRVLDLSWYGPEVLRVRAWEGEEPDRESFSVVAAPAAPAGWELREEGGHLVLAGPGLGARVGADGTVAFERGGRRLLAELPGRRAFPVNDLPNPEDRRGAEQAFAVNGGEALYGLGQFPSGEMNWRGRQATLIHGNVTVAVPFLWSTGGWGLLWDNPSHTEFADGEEGMRLWSEVADGVDYYLCAGAGPDAPIAGYRRLTGEAPLFPRGFYGFIQCKERYRTAEELVAVVAEHRRRGLPLDVIVQDWQYWGGGEQWSSMRHDPETFGDLPGAIAKIHRRHARLMISIWPVLGRETALAAELKEAGHLFPPLHWSGGWIYDAFSPEARAIYWRHAEAGLFDLGVDAWWMDGTEPEFAECHDPLVHKGHLLAQRDTAAGSWARVLNAFSLQTTKGVYEGQRAADEARRVFILTRSAFAGQQRYAAATWSGDISASWKTFAGQIPAGLNFCLAGLPYWTTDNGAFFVRGRGATFPEGVADPAFREFFLRWFQYSCFCPLMRSHGTQTPREIWQFGEPGEEIHDALVAFARLRMRLLPYSYALADRARVAGYTPMRALAMDFGADAATHAVADQFMYGPALMACPVTRPMVHPPAERCDVLTAWGQCRVAGENGIRMRVFDGLEADEPAEDAVVKKDLDHSWSGNRPGGVTGEAYRVEFACDLVADRPGDRARKRFLLVRAAGRLRVELGGATVVDDWVDGPSREHRIPVAPVPGGQVPLRIVFGHAGAGDAAIKAGWEIPEDAWGEPIGGALEREVYLPAGTWYDFWTGAALAGGRRVRLAAPLARLPVLVPAGSILPLGPVKQWQDEVPDDPLELRIFPGADAAFTLYEDAGDGYAYERGACSRIHLAWDDAARRLTVAAREGYFPGMLDRRRIRAVVVRPNQGIGIEPASGADAVLEYGGEALAVELPAVEGRSG